MNKKITFMFLIITCLIFALSTNIFAITRYSFSVGQNGCNSTDPDTGEKFENPFATNAKNSWLSYGNLPTISSKLSTTTLSINLLNSPLPNGKHKLESNVVFLNGHADSTSIDFSYLDDSRYLTGVYYGNSYTDDRGYNYVGLNTLNLNDTQLITFAGCSTGAGKAGDSNLLSRSVERGAKFAVGFDKPISSRLQQGIRWLKKYNEALTSFTIPEAIHTACVWAPTSNLSTSVVYTAKQGYQNMNLYSSYSSNSNNSTSTYNTNLNNNISTVKNTINETFLTKQLNIPFTENFDHQKIQNEIKELEPNFNINDYKVIEHFYNEEFGNGAIYYYYYIDGIIKTNKVYIAQIENNIITELTLAGVQKDNIKNINSLNKNTLVNKLQDKSKIIERNNKIPSVKSANATVTSSEYMYDYNTNTLSQIVYFSTITKNNSVQHDAMELIL